VSAPTGAVGQSAPVASETLSTVMPSAITLMAAAKATVVRHSRSYERRRR
jgi:hypothetical protein